ncbi:MULTISPECIES: hypothetical protein [unclassified Neorhizobium]|uniref:hypothetical protein n=1 Tax=unclassified Neorhizobium TaxID=2629175 RepID=UPI001FF4613B|nr:MULTISPECIES: hypothetical protein [unclassified Neorhizobium]MCJ9669434.1 hypothetical protein [Neorhizobium sp. SHOUNA12B]MCJ9745541.1 hypothetical protein [Neorhizobium sp. SHOUNA12A]
MLKLLGVISIASGGWKLIAFGLAGLFVLAMMSMATGKYFLSPSTILGVLLAGLTGNHMGTVPSRTGDLGPPAAGRHDRYLRRRVAR